MNRSLAFFAALCALFAAARPAFCAGLNPGDVLVTNYGTPNVQHYNSSGTLVNTFTGTGTLWEGCAITPGANIVVSYRNGSNPGLDIFNGSGGLLRSFATPQVGSFPGGVAVFADGTIAEVNQSANVQLYSQTGTNTGSLTTSTLDGYVDALAPDNTLWVGGGSGELTQFTEAGTVLEHFAVGTGVAGICVASDGTLYVTSTTNEGVVHYSPSGTVLSSFLMPNTYGSSTNGIAMSPQGTLYISGAESTSIYDMSTTGTVIGTMPLTNPNNPDYIAVVAPEPASLALIALGALGLLARRRSSLST